MPSSSPSAQKKSVQGPTPNAARRKVRGLNSDIDQVILRGKVIRASVTQELIDCQIERSIDSSSVINLTFNDPDRLLQQHALLQDRVDVELDGLFFRFVALSKQGKQAVLTFEDRDVARLRNRFGATKAYRDTVTRAEFIASLIREVKPRIPIYSPELHKEQPIAGNQDASTTYDISRQDKRGGSGGLDSGSSVSVKNVRANPTQIKYMQTVLDTGVSMGANKKVLISAVATVTFETAWINNCPIPTNPAYSGLFSQNNSSGAWPASCDVAKDAAGYFRVAIAKDKAAPSLAIGALCDAVQVCDCTAGYQSWVAEATNTVDEYLGGSGTASTVSGSATTTSYKKYAFERQPGENTWDAAGRLTAEVGWIRFMSAGIAYIVAEPDMYHQKVAMRIDESSDGIYSIDYSWDQGKPITEVTVKGECRGWAAPPGTLVVIKKGFGLSEISDERFIVSSIRTSPFSNQFDATLKRPTNPKPEPAPESVTHTTQFGDQGGLASTPAADAGSLKGVQISTQPGSPHWGGSGDILHSYVTPFMSQHGLSPGSEKRTPAENDAAGGSPTSDHLSTNVTADAIDYPTGSGEGAASALAQAMGNSSWQMNTEASFGISVGGYSFSCQIIWGAAVGHGDHVHVGIHRA